MRPTYEQIEDRERQGQIAAELCQAWDLADVFPLPTHSCADYLLLDRNSGLSLAELKCRSVSSLHYPTLILSRQKVLRIIACADALSLPFYLIVQWLDGIFWQQLVGSDLLMLKVTRGGRVDRQDAGDMETVYEIPTASFKPLGMTK